MRNEKGFTLIELVIVMVLGGIIMAIAATSLQALVRRHAPEELISELHLARMVAIRRHNPVAVTFTPNTGRCAVWVRNEAGVVGITRTIDLGDTGDRFQFDPNPPGAPPPPDNQLNFSPLGFISTPGGLMSGNIYLTNRDNTRRFQIQTTIAGGIDLFRYNPGTATWDSAY